MLFQILTLHLLATSGAAPFLPEGPLVVGYATSRSLRENKLVRAVDDGVNVVIFAFVHLEMDPETSFPGVPRVRPTFDLGAVRETIRQIRATHPRSVAFLCAFGGWNGPHPHTSLSGRAWFEHWHAWNVAHGSLFDGVDWDLEGHDDPTSPTAQISAATVDLVAEFSVRAHAAGYAVFIAPAESYLDASSPQFNLRLDNEPLSPWGDADAPGYPGLFPYAGRNAYASVLRKAGVDVFSLISVQLYEGYSRACHAVAVRGVPPEAYIVAAARELTSGFSVDFDDVRLRLRVPHDRLAFGFANSWADGRKFLSVDAASVASAYRILRREGIEPRGVMFWVIDEEGASPPPDAGGRRGRDSPQFFARELTAAFSGKNSEL